MAKEEEGYTAMDDATPKRKNSNVLMKGDDLWSKLGSKKGAKKGAKKAAAKKGVKRGAKRR